MEPGEIEKAAYHFLMHSKFLQGKVFGYHHCGPNWEWNPVAFQKYDLWYIVSGKGTLCLHGRSHDLKKGSCFLFKPGDHPKAWQDEKDRLTVIFLHFHVKADMEPAISGKLPLKFHVQDTYGFETKLFQLLELCDSVHLWVDEEFDLALKQVLLELFRGDLEKGETGKFEIKYTRMMRKLIVRIRNYPSDPLLPEEVTEITGLSYRYAGKLFRQFTGNSLQQYMIRVKLEKALYLLKETNMNVSQVAETLGYSSLHFFSRQFKNKYGAAPSDFLNTHD